MSVVVSDPVSAELDCFSQKPRDAPGPDLKYWEISGLLAPPLLLPSQKLEFNFSRKGHFPFAPARGQKVAMGKRQQ